MTHSASRLPAEPSILAFFLKENCSELLGVTEVPMGAGTEEVGVSISGVMFRTIETGWWRGGF